MQQNNENLVPDGNSRILDLGLFFTGIALFCASVYIVAKFL